MSNSNDTEKKDEKPMSTFLQIMEMNKLLAEKVAKERAETNKAIIAGLTKRKNKKTTF